LLSDVRYVSTVVAYLEQHPDVVACASDFSILSHEMPGGLASQNLPELYEDRAWEEARRDFFVWPQNASSYAIYSMFRSDALARTPMHQRRYRGKLNPAWWEMPFLSTLAGYGRIVALPMHLRTFRWVNTSAGWRTYQMAPAFDLFILGLWTKLLLLRVALSVPLPIFDRWALVQATIENFFRANFSRPMDVPNLIVERQREYLRLRQTARERAELIRSLVGQIEERRLTVPASAVDAGRWNALVREARLVAEGVEPDLRQLDQRLARFEHAKPVFWEFFQATPQWQLSLCEDINRAVGMIRTLCDERVDLVERLHSYAETLQETATLAREQDYEALREKERVIAELKATAYERLRLYNEAEADARHARAVSEQLTAELQEKVGVIVNLAASADERLDVIATIQASADERLRLVEEAHAEAAHARQVAEQLIEQLHEKDQLIADLAASADERLRLVEEAHADAANARRVTEQLIAQLQEKDRVIVTLTSSADERLHLVEEAHADATHARQAADQLMHQLQEKDQLIVTLTTSADERLDLISTLKSSADERLSLLTTLKASGDERLGLIEAAHADAANARQAAEQLIAQLQEKDRVIEELAASTDERLRLLNEASDAASREREASQALAAQLRQKEQAIEELSIAAEARLQLAQDASAEAQKARSRVERLTIELDEKEQVITGLMAAAAERLSIIERLSQEAMQGDPRPAPHQP
jgi:hypothetical protein